MPLIYDRQSAQELAEVVFQWERWASAFYRFFRNTIRRPKGPMCHDFGNSFTVESKRIEEPPSGFPSDSITTVGGFAIVPMEHGFQIYTPCSIFSEAPLLEITGVVGGRFGAWTLKDGSRITHTKEQASYEFT